MLHFYLFRCFLIVLLVLKLSACSDSIWHSYQYGWGYSNREELVITNVTCDVNFKLDNTVIKWHTITVGLISYGIGVMSTSVAVLKANINSNKTFSLETTVLDLEQNVIDVSLLENWNKTTKKSEVIAVMATSGKIPTLQWYKFETNTTKLTKFWTWDHLIKNITHINTFVIEYTNHIIIVNDFYEGKASADVYEYDLKSHQPNFWLQQTILLEDTTNSTSLNFFGPDIFLNIPQKSQNSLYIYRYSNSHFIPYKNITSERIEEVISFNIGFKTYFAIDGLNAGIFQITKNGITKEKVKDSNLDGIHYWLSVPMKTYRDEVILLAQRILDHSSHKSFITEMIMYNGGAFEEHEDIRCRFYGEITNNFICMTDSSNNGIIGSSSIVIGDTVGLLVPKDNATYLFMVYSEFRRKESPVEIQQKNLLETLKKLEQKIQLQKEQYEELLQQLNKHENTTSEKNHIVSAAFIKNTTVSKSPAKDGKKKFSTEAPFRRDADENSKRLDGLRQDIEAVRIDIIGMKEKMDNIVNSESLPKYKSVIINGIAEIKGDLTTKTALVKSILDEPANEILQDIVRKQQIGKMVSEKTFSDLEIENIQFETVNEIPAENLAFKSENPLVLNGDITFQNNVTVSNDIVVTSNLINNISLIEEIININKPYDGKLSFQNVVSKSATAETVNGVPVESEKIRNAENGKIGEPTVFEKLEVFEVPHNITVKKINGEDFEDFLKQICCYNIKSFIPGRVKIIGNITINDAATTNSINGLKFPEDFIFTNSMKGLNITGAKTFTNSLTVKTIRAPLIDGLDTSTIITLSNDQKIPGTIIFNDLNPTEGLKVNGEIKTDGSVKFLQNPTLMETNEIKSNVNFKDLEVEGDIILGGHFNDVNFSLYSDDIIYKDLDNPVISGLKQFLDGFTVRNNLEIETNAINNVDLDSIITKDTDQILSITTLNGVVNFENIYVNGLYDEINVTELYKNSIKLDENELISSTLQFTDDSLKVANLEIVNTINNNEVSHFDFENNEDTSSKDVIELDNINAENIHVKGAFSGNIEEFDIVNFEQTRMSYSREQIIENLSVNNSEIEELISKTINNVGSEEILDVNTIVDKIIAHVQSGQMDIENLQVNGSMVIQNINENDMGLTHENFTEKDIDFDTIEIHGDAEFDEIVIEKLGGVSFDHFIENIVFKNEKNVNFSSHKEFLNGFSVEKLITTTTLNGIPLENFMRQQSDQKIEGPIEIVGNVVFEKELEVGYIDEILFEDVSNNFTKINDTYFIKGDVMYNKLAHIYNLYVSEYINDVYIKDFLENIAYTNGANNFIGKTIFENQVEIKGDLNVEELLNTIKLQAFASQIVLKNKDETVDNPVIFKSPVHVIENINIDGDLQTKYLFGIQLEEWKENAVFINKGLLKGNYIFDNVIIQESLSTKFINNMNMSSIVSLRSTESIDQLFIGQMMVFNDIGVNNTVNDNILKNVFDNTVMQGKDQNISTEIIFNENILIRGDLNIHGKINNKTVDKIVTTNTDQNLTAIYHFDTKKLKYTIINSNIKVTGLINGINITNWPKEAIKTDSLEMQVVDDNWNIEDNLMFKENIEGKGLINGMDIHNVTKEIEEKTKNKYERERAVIDDYQSICKDVKFIHKSALNQIYKFKYFEVMEVIDFQNSVKNVHYFEHNNNHYLLVSEERECIAHLFILKNSSLFVPHSDINIGEISSIVDVKSNDGTYLITNNNLIKNCNISGTNVWKLIGKELKHIQIIDNQELLQSSNVPNTFYGASFQGVTEFKLKFGLFQKYRIWNIYEDNMEFVPRGLKTGLSLRTGSQLIKLNRQEPIGSDPFGTTEAEVIIKGNFTKQNNRFFPGKTDGDMAVLNVATNSRKRALLAVATHEETSVKGRMDFIKIYEEPVTGKVFHKVQTYKPSNLISVEFDNGETLLVFLEEHSNLQVYEYKGIEGFTHRASAELKGTKLYSIQLPSNQFLNKRNALAVINGNSISLIEAVMTGNQVDNNLECGLSKQ